MTTNRLTELSLRRLAEKGLASLGQLQRLDEIERENEIRRAQERALSDFDNVGRTR